MGKGKGEPDYWAATVRPGTVLYELSGVTEEAAKICFARLAHKMPVRVRMVKRESKKGISRKSLVLSMNSSGTND